MYNSEYSKPAFLNTAHSYECFIDAINDADEDEAALLAAWWSVDAAIEDSDSLEEIDPSTLEAHIDSLEGYQDEEGDFVGSFFDKSEALRIAMIVLPSALKELDDAA